MSELYEKSLLKLDLDQILLRLPLVAKQGVSRLTWSDMFIKALKSMITGA